MAYKNNISHMQTEKMILLNLLYQMHMQSIKLPRLN